MTRSKSHRTGAGLLVILVVAVLVCPTAAAPIKVFIVAGQSNGTGYAGNASDLPTSLQSPQSNVWFVDGYYDYHHALIQGTASSTPWGALAPQSRKPWTYFGDTHFEPSIDPGHGPEITLGRDLAAYYGTSAQVAILKYTPNGSGLYPLTSATEPDWNVNSSEEYHVALTRDIVPDLLAKLAAQSGESVEVAGMFWIQGEEDSLNTLRSGVYQQNLQDLIDDIRGNQSWASADLPFIIERTHSNASLVPSIDPNALAGVRGAQVAIADGDDDIAWVNTDDLSLYSDNLHFDSAGEQLLGERLADAYIGVVPEPASLLVLGLGAVGLILRRQAGRREA